MFPTAVINLNQLANPVCGSRVAGELRLARRSRYLGIHLTTSRHTLVLLDIQKLLGIRRGAGGEGVARLE